MSKAGVVSLSAAAVLCFTTVAAAETSLRFNRWIPPSHFVYVEVHRQWAADIERVTDGRVTVEFTASSLGPPQRQFDLAKDGVADITWGTEGYVAGRFILPQMAALPFLADSAEVASVAYWRTYQRFFAGHEHDGVKVLAVHTHPGGKLFTGAKQVASLDDLKGMKIRIVNPVTAKLLETFGGVPVSGAATQAYDLVSRGVVDGTFFNDDSIFSFKLLDHIRHVTEVPGGFYNTSFFLVMNQPRWRSLAAADRDAIDAISGEAFATLVGATWDAKSASGAKELDARGATRHRLGGEALATLKQRLAFVEREWIEEAGKLGIDGQAALAYFRDQAARYTPKDR